MNKKFFTAASAVIIFVLGAFTNKMTAKYQATQLFYSGGGACHPLTGVFASQGVLTTMTLIYQAEINTAFNNKLKRLYATSTCHTKVYFTGD